MRLKKAYISTLNGKAFYYYLKLLRSANIPFEITLPDSKEALEGVAFTTKEESRGNHKDKVFFEDMSFDETVDIMRAVKALSRFRNVNLGIDPGKATGVALTLDSYPLIVKVFYDLEDLINFVVKVMGEFRSITIKVGDGNPEVASKILEGLSRILRKGDVLMLVSEKRTTPKGKATYRKDMSAAVKIASREGKIYN
ncbi:MAG: hypothetical protein ACP5LF_04450 [Nitrososphaeria archaeon]|nr:hypothetical protein [Conexivisphaerales archaeon]